MEKLEGIILKGIGGFYYVEAAGEVYECKARGLFRKTGIKPLAGDRVEISVNDRAENTIEQIHERSGEFVRPPVANVDRLFIVASVCEPKPVLLVIDRLTAIAVNKGVEPIVLFTKCDLGSAEEYVEIYRKAGILSFAVCAETGEGVERVRRELSGHISAFCGNTGVGKSTLLNAVDPSLSLKTGEISDKLGRGRHTTRQSELFKVEGGYVADTPGFSTFDIERYRLTDKEKLPYGFREFLPYLGQCQFTSCSHTCEKGCAILQAVEKGEIPRQRHESYCAMYQEIKDVKQWQQRNKNV